MTTATRVERSGSSQLSVALSAGYAGFAYAAFTGAFLYAGFFLAPAVVPRTVDKGGPASSHFAAVVVDVLLLGLFGLQHTVMARPAFKDWLTRTVPRHVERSTFVLAASAVLVLTFWLWRPITTTVWHVHSQAARDVMWIVGASGWLFAFAMTFAFDHAELFGLRQVSAWRRGEGERSAAFRVPLAYRLVRHPMMTGFIVAFLAVPTMTAGHLLFALLSCGYIFVGVRFEEHDLAKALPQYDEYAARTPRFVPRRLKP